jgi:zinc protease
MLASTLLYLANGLPVTTARAPGAPVAAVQAWVSAGAADEDAPQAGVAHLLEHMVFRPSTPGGSPLARAVEDVGGEVNAWTSLDQTVFHAVVPVAELPTAIAAVGDAVASPRLEPEALERERGVVLDELSAHAGTPSRRLMGELFASAYVLHGYRRPVIGDHASVRRIRTADLEAFHRAHYVAGNVHLVVVGDVEPDAVARLAASTFGRLARGRGPTARRREPTQRAPRARLAAGVGPSAHVALAFHAPPAASADVAAMDVLAATLGGHDDELGDVRARHVVLRDGGLVVLDAVTEPGREAEVARRLHRRVDETIASLTRERIDGALTALAAERTLQAETVQGVGHELGWRHSSGQALRSATALPPTLDEVRTVAARWLRAGGANAVAITPRRISARAAAGRGLLARPPRRAPAVAVAPSVPVTRPPSPSPAPASVAATSTQTLREVLDNGLTVVVRSDPRVPVVAMRAMWLGGSRLETDADAGITSLLASAMVRGCGARDAAATAAAVEQLAGSLGAVAGRNSLTVRGEFMTARWREGLALLADCALAPRLARDEVAAQREAQVERVRADAATPAHVAFRLFTDALYGRHPYHLPALGTVASLRALQHRRLRHHFEQHYPVTGLTLVIVGDVDAADALAEVKARFGAAPRRAPASPAVVAVTPPTSPREVYAYAGQAQATVVVGFLGARTSAGDRLALELLVQHLGGQSGRLFTELRDRRGLAYQVSTYAVDGVDPGYLAFYVTCPDANVDAVVAALQAELAAVRAGGVAPADLARAKRRMIGAHQVALQRRAAIANALAYYEIHGLGWQAWDGYPAALAAVTGADVDAAARRFLDPQAQVTAIVRPPSASPAAIRRSHGRRPSKARRR